MADDLSNPIAIARLLGELTSEVKNVRYDVRDMAAQLAGYVPRRELDQSIKTVTERLDELEEKQRDNARDRKIDAALAAVSGGSGAAGIWGLISYSRLRGWLP